MRAELTRSEIQLKDLQNSTDLFALAEQKQLVVARLGKLRKHLTRLAPDNLRAEAYVVRRPANG